jgi:hypothetical protein
MWHVDRAVERVSWVGDVKKKGGPTCRYPVSLSASLIFTVVGVDLVVIIAVRVLRDVALARCWVGISEYEGWRRRCTYLESW